MRPTSLLFSLSLITFIGVVLSKRPQELTDVTFEHDTQARTGATTGDWFISFCDRVTDRAKCIETDAVWNQLAETLNRRVSVATVDL